MKRRETAYQKVIRLMREDISKKDLKPDQEFLTDREASKRYGVSLITVRRAFMELEQEGVIYRVRGKGTFVGKNPLKKLKMVAFVGSCLVHNTVEPLFIRGIDDYLVKHDFNIIVCNVDNSIERARHYFHRLAAYRIEGIIFVPLLTSSELNQEIIEHVLKKGIPCVLIDRFVPGLENVLPSVSADNLRGGRLVTDHLIALGHRRIAFYCNNPFDVSSSVQERLEGYRKALENAGIQLDSKLIACGELSTIPSVIKRWSSMPEPPTAIFCEHDMLTVRMIEHLQAHGMRIPEDISIVGFDDLPNIPTQVPLTTIHVDHREEGQVAASHLIEIINHTTKEPHRIVLPVRLVIRQSTGVNPQLLQNLPKGAAQDNRNSPSSGDNNIPVC